MEAFAVISWSMLVLLTALPFCVEIAAAAAQFLLTRASVLQLAELKATAAHLKKEIAKITSPADFVTRAKYERELIAVEKMIDAVKEHKASATRLAQNVSRIVKAVLYLAAFALCWGQDVVVVDARLLWPITTLSPFHNPLFGVAIGPAYLLPLSIAAASVVSNVFFAL